MPACFCSRVENIIINIITRARMNGRRSYDTFLYGLITRCYRRHFRCTCTFVSIYVQCTQHARPTSDQTELRLRTAHVDIECVYKCARLLARLTARAYLRTTTCAKGQRETSDGKIQIFNTAFH